MHSAGAPSRVTLAARCALCISMLRLHLTADVSLQRPDAYEMQPRRREFFLFLGLWLAGMQSLCEVLFGLTRLDRESSDFSIVRLMTSTTCQMRGSMKQSCWKLSSLVRAGQICSMTRLAAQECLARCRPTDYQEGPNNEYSVIATTSFAALG